MWSRRQSAKRAKVPGNFCRDPERPAVSPAARLSPRGGGDPRHPLATKPLPPGISRPRVRQARRLSRLPLRASGGR